jgi:uncharacterized protein YndB with AHSA1/START domain
MNEATGNQETGGLVLNLECTLDAPPEEVFRMLLTEERLALHRTEWTESFEKLQAVLRTRTRNLLSPVALSLLAAIGH